MIEKQYLVELLEKEFATTLKLMRAYPDGQFELKPHERSSSAKTLMSTFVFEMYLLASYIFGETIAPDAYATYDPENVGKVIEDFENETKKVLEKVKGYSAEDMTTTIEFGGRSFRAGEFIMMMLHDQIHHRGQLSVYIRLAGGKVPSIYGPSADDTSTNL